MKVKESLNVTFDESPPLPKTSPLVDDDLVEEEAIKVSRMKQGFLSQKGSENGRGVKEKNQKHALNNEVAIDSAVPSAIIASWNNNGTQDENVGLCSCTFPLDEGNVLINTNDPNNSGPSLSGPTSLSYARAMTELRFDVELKDIIMVAMPKLVDDDDVGTNGRNSKSAGKGSLNVVHGSSSNTSIIEKVVTKGNEDSKSEVEVVFDETANLMALTSLKCESDSGYGTNSLLKQWRETKRDDDYDPYDDYLYEIHDMSEDLQAICDNLDITCVETAFVTPSGGPDAVNKISDVVIKLRVKLHFVLDCVLSWTAFCQALRFAYLKTIYCVLLRTNSSKIKTALRFISVQAVEATNNSLAVPEHTTVGTPSNMSPENKSHFLAEKEAIHLILTGIGDDIYLTVDACQTAQEMWEALERLQQGESLNIQDVKTNLFWEFSKFTSHDGETMESYYTRFYKLMNEMIRNNLTVTTMQVNVQFLQQLQPEWPRKPKRVKDSAYHKEKMLLCKQAEQGVPLQAEQYDWLADMDEEVDEQELEAHYSYMDKIQKVPNADSGTDSEPAEQVQNNAECNVFANELQHSEQSESVSNTCLVETDDSNVTHNSPD
nr:hypothetical protein [Tanacetum cinerariifolium]